MMVLWLSGGAILGAVVVGVVIGLLSRTKSKWGINLGPTDCPTCGMTMPAVRRPLNVRQAMWGGWTCPACKCEMDKYGRALKPGGKGQQGQRLP